MGFSPGPCRSPQPTSPDSERRSQALAPDSKLLLLSLRTILETRTLLSGQDEPTAPITRKGDGVVPVAMNNMMSGHL